MLVFSKEPTDLDVDSPYEISEGEVKIRMEVSEQATLDEVLSAFKGFLAASGFVVDGLDRLELVPEEAELYTDEELEDIVEAVIMERKRVETATEDTEDDLFDDDQGAD